MFRFVTFTRIYERQSDGTTQRVAWTVNLAHVQTVWRKQDDECWLKMTDGLQYRISGSHAQISASLADPLAVRA